MKDERSIWNNKSNQSTDDLYQTVWIIDRLQYLETKLGVAKTKMAVPGLIGNFREALEKLLDVVKLIYSSSQLQIQTTCLYPSRLVLYLLPTSA